MVSFKTRAFILVVYLPLFLYIDSYVDTFDYRDKHNKLSDLIICIISYYDDEIIH